MKGKVHKILDCKLIKAEKSFNQVKPNRFFYNFQLEGIEDLLLLETDIQLDQSIVGMNIKYKLNAENEVSDFELS